MVKIERFINEEILIIFEVNKMELDLTKLVENTELQDPNKLGNKAVLAFGKIFRTNSYNSWLKYLNPKNLLSSSLPTYTKDEIAEILFRNGLLSSLEEGLRNVDSILTEEFSFSEYSKGFYQFKEVESTQGKAKYRLSHFIRHDVF